MHSNKAIRGGNIDIARVKRDQRRRWAVAVMVFFVALSLRRTVLVAVAEVRLPLRRASFAVAVVVAVVEVLSLRPARRERGASGGRVSSVRDWRVFLAEGPTSFEVDLRFL